MALDPQDSKDQLARLETQVSEALVALQVIAEGLALQVEQALRAIEAQLDREERKDRQGQQDREGHKGG